jgi:SAM-dependent methyltransferase
MTKIEERDYVLGTHDEEIERLGLQHRVWRPRALAAWQRAGITVGQTVLDVGCGPGYATVDMAEIVGPDGRIIAVDRSHRFLDALEGRRRQRGLENISVIESDLDDAHFERGVADAAWCRWVLAFVRDPSALVQRVTTALKPGGVFVAHEYFDYAAWRVAPRSELFEEFVRETISNWRGSGGEPDVGLALPRWLEELGYEIESLTPIIDVISPRDYAWHWPWSFMGVGRRRLVELGRISAERASAMEREFDEIERSPSMRMITPGVLQVIARRR